MRCILVTNNSKCYEAWKSRYQVDFLESGSYLDVLIASRDYIHQGYYLLTHPMAGSLKPNQIPYKSILLALETAVEKEPFEDVELIENSIAAYYKFIGNKALPAWPPATCEDFKTVDLSLMEGVMQNPILCRR